MRGRFGRSGHGKGARAAGVRGRMHSPGVGLGGITRPILAPLLDSRRKKILGPGKADRNTLMEVIAAIVVYPAVGILAVKIFMEITAK